MPTNEVACPHCAKPNAYTASICAHCNERIAIVGRDEKDGMWWIGCLIPIVIIGFLLYNCSGQETDTGPSEGAVWVVVQNNTKARLRDPSSAEFSGMHSIEKDGKIIGACGSVNSKNGFGGMSGPKRFIGGGNINAIEGDGMMDSSNFNEAWNRMCR